MTVNYNPAGDNLPTVLSTAVEGGNPPDIAAIAQPGLMQGFVEQGVLEPLDYIEDAAVDNFGQSVVDTGSIDGTFYGLTGRRTTSRRSGTTAPPWRRAGVEAPATWDDFIAGRRDVKASGLPAYSIAGADGWTLTDLFENVSIRGPPVRRCTTSSPRTRSRGPTSPSRTRSPRWGRCSRTATISPGAPRAHCRPTSRRLSATSSRRARRPSMVIEADFVNGVVETSLEAPDGVQRLHVPDDRGLAPVGRRRGQSVHRVPHRTPRSRRSSST